MRAIRFIVGWFLALAVGLLRRTVRVTEHGDPRPALRAAGVPYVYAILHCHQIGAVIACEPGTGAMVSRSVDGDLLVPSLRLHGIIPMRGSSSRHGKDKGGADALMKLIEHVRAGRPGYLAVDGPRGPRNFVNRGIGLLAQATKAAVIAAVPVPQRRWILTRTWDRLQIPKPFTHMDVYWAPPLRIQDGESVESFCGRIGVALEALEGRTDPEEAAHGQVAADRRRARNEREAAERRPGADQ